MRAEHKDRPYCYTTEQLSLILSEHAAGQLQRGGEPDFGSEWNDHYPRACIQQVVLNEPHVMAAYFSCQNASWFDQNYQPSWTPETFLLRLQQAGMV